MSSSAYNDNVEDWKITGTLKDEDGNDIPKVATNPELKKVFEELYLYSDFYFTFYTTQSISTPDINNLITTNIQNYIDGKPQEYFDNQILQLPIVENRLKGNDEINEDQEFLKKALIGKNSEVFKEALYVQDYLFRRRGYLPVTNLVNLDDQKPSIIDFISKNIDTQVTKEYLDKNPNYITNETTGPKICFMFALSSFISKGEYSYGLKHRSKNENQYVINDFRCYSPNFYSQLGGSGTDYSHIINMIMNGEVTNNKKSQIFQKVLRQTNLLSYTNLKSEGKVKKCN